MGLWGHSAAEPWGWGAAGCWGGASARGRIPGAGGLQAARVLRATGAVGLHEPQVQNQEAQLQEFGGRGAAGPEGEYPRTVLCRAMPCRAMPSSCGVAYGRTG